MNAGNRGMAGMDESLSFRIHQLAGAVAPNTNYLHFRVIDNAVETSPTDQYTGDLWGLYLAIEEIDGGLLVEVSADLVTWSADAVLESQDATTATYVFEPGDEEGQHFIRLRVEQRENL